MLFLESFFRLHNPLFVMSYLGRFPLNFFHIRAIKLGKIFHRLASAPHFLSIPHIFDAERHRNHLHLVKQTLAPDINLCQGSEGSESVPKSHSLLEQLAIM